MRYLRRSRGFTLLEVLVAVAVLAVALASLIKGVAANADNAAYLRDRTFSQWVALNVVAEKRLGLLQASDNRGRGSERMGGHTWYWRYQLSETFDEGVQRMDVEVAASDETQANPLSRVVAFIPAMESRGRGQ